MAVTNFKRFGIARDRVKKLVVLPRTEELKEITIILVTKPEDEAAARATSVKSRALEKVLMSRIDPLNGAGE